MSYIIKMVCAWCNKEMGTKTGGVEEGLVSHTICQPCMDKELAKFEKGVKNVQGCS